jgi:hypothetical protein
MRLAHNTKVHGWNGFQRDVKLFSQAMLARQCWGLITELEDSLCAQVLKGRYFPGGYFLNFSTTRSCSFTWRSLMFGKDLLQQGIILKIGEGDKVRITSDRWILEAPCVTPKKERLIKLDLSLIRKRLRGWPNFEFLNRCSDGRTETVDVKISSKRIRLTTHMLDSEFRWIANDSSIFSYWIE